MRGGVTEVDGIPSSFWSECPEVGRTIICWAAAAVEKDAERLKAEGEKAHGHGIQ